MKTVKKIISVFLTALILLSAFSAFAGAEQSSDISTEKKDAAPFVFVHGLGGWGQYDDITEKMPYWGGGGGMTISDGDVIGLMEENGYEAYAASVSPVESGNIEPGVWYYMNPLYSMDHGDYCNAGSDYPDGYESFYLEIAKTVER